MSNDTPFMRWHVDAYLGDTGHLTCLEHGAYTQILWACWKRGGSVPERHLQRLVGMTLEQWAESRDMLAEFFTVDNGTWSHGKVAEEIEHVSSRREAAQKAGKASSKARKARANPSATSANDERLTNDDSTDAQQSFNARSTDAQHNPNHEEEEQEKEVEKDKDSYLPTVDNNNSLLSSPSAYIDRLRDVHGYELKPNDRLAVITQAKQWIDDGVTPDELDVAVQRSREQLMQKNDTRDPPARYVAEVIKGGREKAAPISAGKKHTPDNAALAAELRNEMMMEAANAH